MIGGGWVYCSRRLESTTVECDQRSCRIAELREGRTRVLTIPVRFGLSFCLFDGV